MNSTPKVLITIGVIFIVIGLIWYIGGRYFSLGKLPGDIVIKKENFTLYFPIVTCLLISLILSIALYLFRFFK